MKKSDKVEIAKNLLLGKTCKNCKYTTRIDPYKGIDNMGYQCMLTGKKVDSHKTCRWWYNWVR